MSIDVIKKAAKTPATDEGNTAQVVREMLQAIERGGEEKAREYAKSLDGWEVHSGFAKYEVKDGMVIGTAVDGHTLVNIAPFEQPCAAIDADCIRVIIC